MNRPSGCNKALLGPWNLWPPDSDTSQDSDTEEESECDGETEVKQHGDESCQESRRISSDPKLSRGVA